MSTNIEDYDNFTCPRCYKPITVPEIKSHTKLPFTVSCQEDCSYSFHFFEQTFFGDYEAAKEYARRKLPSVGPRHIFPGKNFWILANEYREVEPLPVASLRDSLGDKTVPFLLQGFGVALNAALTVVERRNGKLSRIDPVKPMEHLRDLCRRVKEYPAGEERCVESIYEIIRKNEDATEPYFSTCWLGLAKYFVPIQIDGRVVATFVCGDMQQKAHQEQDSNIIKKQIIKATTLIGEGREKLEAEAGLLQLRKTYRFWGREEVKQDSRFLTWHEPEVFAKRCAEIREYADLIQNLAENVHDADRRTNDGRFIQELGAIFITTGYEKIKYPLFRRSFPPDPWPLLAFILKRITKFLEMKEGIFFKEEVRGEKKMWVAKAWSREGMPQIILEQGPSKSFFNQRKNLCGDNKKIIDQGGEPLILALEKTLKTAIKWAVLCPISLHEEGEGFLAMVNLDRSRNNPCPKPFHRVVRNIVREVSHHLNHILAMHRLEYRKELLTHYIFSTFHTLNQSIYTISSGWRVLKCLDEKGGSFSNKFFRGMAGISKGVVDLERMVRTLFGFISEQNAGEEYLARFRPESFSFNELLGTSIRRFEPKADSRGIRFQLEYDKNIGEVKWSKGHIEILLWNLIDNAIKYSHRNMIVTIKVKYVNSAKEIEFQVVNRGFGIPVDERDEIFTYGFQSNLPQRLRPNPGAGLGLYLVKQIVNRHRGIIEVESSREGRQYFKDDDINWEGFETVFTVSLPVTIS